MATIPLTVTIKDYRYSANITVPTGVTPPLPPTPPPPPPPTPTGGEARIVKILPETQNRLSDANEGQTVNITATVICRSDDGSISKPSDTAYLIVDGAIYDRKPTSNGTVTFEWQATSVPASIHNICVKVDPSSSCKSPGQDCKRITVSPIILSPSEQLAKEKASAAEQKRLLEEARSALRGQIIGAELQVPGVETPSIPYTPPTEITPTPPPPPPPSTPTPLPDVGDISIIGLPAPLLPITPDLPLYIYIDDKNVGRLYELPKTISNVSVGSHSVYIRAGNINTPVKTVYVIKSQTTTVTL